MFTGPGWGLTLCSPQICSTLSRCLCLCPNTLTYARLCQLHPLGVQLHLDLPAAGHGGVVVQAVRQQVGRPGRGLVRRDHHIPVVPRRGDVQPVRHVADPVAVRHAGVLERGHLPDHARPAPRLWRARGPLPLRQRARPAIRDHAGDRPACSLVVQRTI